MFILRCSYDNFVTEENTKQLIKHSSIIFLRLSNGCSARHLPDKNKGVWGTSPIPQLCPEHYLLRLSQSVFGS
jgi:hypothetical protein